METFRKWGDPPYSVAVVHGGPGAPGSVAGIARGLSTDFGVLEPFQSKGSLDGQVGELKEIIEEQADLPAVVIGWSHGASVSCLLAAAHPAIVKKLIVIGMTPFDYKYQKEIWENRSRRFSDEERAEFFSYLNGPQDADEEKKKSDVKEIFRMVNKVETFAAIQDGNGVAGYNDDVLEYRLHPSLNSDYQAMFESKRSLEIVPRIKCPVVAIHGDYDVLPADGVKETFAMHSNDFRFVLLEKCGHTPWYEKYARDEFFSVVREEVNDN